MKTENVLPEPDKIGGIQAPLTNHDETAEDL